MQNSTIFKKIMKNIAIFASGSGTNAENLIHFFRTDPIVRVGLVLTNNQNAGVIQRAQSNDIETLVFSRTEFYESEKILNLMKQRGIDFVVLAGFLWLVPDNILKTFENKVVNIHPALLPNYGGKGMYGRHVHEAVIANGEKESGITIHYVNARYDEGDIIFQARCKVKSDDTPESLASRIHQLEYEHFPQVVEKLLKEL
jgi:phosphoribosylglycinamide formyltransferase-1